MSVCLSVCQCCQHLIMITIVIPQVTLMLLMSSPWPLQEFTQFISCTNWPVGGRQPSNHRPLVLWVAVKGCYHLQPALNVMCCPIHSQWRWSWSSTDTTAATHLMALCSGWSMWAITRRNIHSRTPCLCCCYATSLINFLHFLWSVLSSLHICWIWQSFSITSLQVFFCLPLGLTRSTS